MSVGSLVLFINGFGFFIFLHIQVHFRIEFILTLAAIVFFFTFVDGSTKSESSNLNDLRDQSYTKN